MSDDAPTDPNPPDPAFLDPQEAGPAPPRGRLISQVPPQAGSAPPDDAPLLLFAPRKPTWLKVLILGLGLGLQLGLSSAGVLIELLERVLPTLPAELRLGFALGVPFSALAGLAVAVYHHETGFLGGRIDARGVLYGPLVEQDRGLLRPWSALAGYRVEGPGVRLVVKGQPWTRWVGPRIAASGAEVQELVERLEQRGLTHLE